MRKEKRMRLACGRHPTAMMICLVMILLFHPPLLCAAASADTAAGRQGDQVCRPLPIAVPVKPKVIPPYAGLDKETGLHVTGTAPDLDFGKYRLTVSGKVNRPLQLTYDELRCLPRVTSRPELVCPGFFVDVASWSGTPLRHILEKAGVWAGAKEVRLTGQDRYLAVLSLRQAAAPDAVIAYEWEGKPLPVLHGFPVRAVLPGLEGNKWVKWLIKIEVN